MVRFSVGEFMGKPYGSYGVESGLWELAVVRFTGPSIGDYKLDYTTPITEDVIGHLNESEVDEILTKIEALKKVHER